MRQGNASPVRRCESCTVRHAALLTTFRAREGAPWSMLTCGRCAVTATLRAPANVRVDVDPASVEVVSLALADGRLPVFVAAA